MSGPSAKRQRANTDDNPVPLALDYKEIIKTFDTKTFRDLLLSAAATSKDVASEVVYRHGEILRAESTKVVDFDHYSKSIWHELAGGGRLRGAQAYELGHDVGWSIHRTIETMANDAGPHNSFGTKKSALVTLRKIGKSVETSEDNAMTLEVISILGRQKSMESAMLKIVDGMNADEKLAMLGDSEWVLKMEELKELGSLHTGLFQGMSRVLRRLGPADVDYVDESESGADLDTNVDSGEDGEESEESEGSEEGAPAGPRRDLCRGCGCSRSSCSSCWGDRDRPLQLRELGYLYDVPT